jgi:hypothetical protein
VLEEASTALGLAKSFIKFEVGDGKNIHMWHDT